MRVEHERNVVAADVSTAEADEGAWHKRLYN